MTRKRVILCLLIFFLAGMLAAAYIAHQIHLRSLPVVETITPAPGTLRNQITVEAVFQYTDEIILRAPADLRVVSLKKRAGDRVKAGETLFAYDLEDVRLALLSCQAEEDALFSRESSELTILLSSRIQEKIDALERLLEEDGQVKSPAEGWVLAVDARAGDRLTENLPVLTLCDGAGGREILWKQPEDGAVYTVALLTEGQQSMTLRNFQTRYDPTTGETYVSAKLPANSGISLPPGRKVTAELRSEARSYEWTLPLACLYQDAAGRQYVYLAQEKDTARGRVTYAIQRTVYVLDRDREHFSFSPALEAPVILARGQALQDQVEVRLSAE